MNGYHAPDSDHRPVLWLGGNAIFAAHSIVVVFVGSLLVTTLAMFFGVDLLFRWLPFSSLAVLQGQVWRILTYGLVNPPSLQFVIDMFMLVWFGRELEKFFGRRTFLYLYGCIYLVTPVLFTLIGLWLPLARSGETGAFAVFVAFATLYPNAVLIFNVLAKWAATILVGIFSLMALAYHDWTGLISLWATTGFAYVYVRYQQGHFTLPRLSFGGRRPRLHVLPDLEPGSDAGVRNPKEPSMTEMDALLDKIARSGLSSLTPKERVKLEKARTNLLP